MIHYLPGYDVAIKEMVRTFSGDCHVPFCGSLGVRFPRRLDYAFRCLDGSGVPVLSPSGFFAVIDLVNRSSVNCYRVATFVGNL